MVHNSASDIRKGDVKLPSVDGLQIQLNAEIASIGPVHLFYVQCNLDND